MRLARYCFLFFSLCLATVPSYAQWAVFDASNLAEAVKEFKQLQQVYTTANQTRDQIIQAYNLAHYMSQMPQNLYQRYNAQFALWTNLNAPNTYGNTGAWITALNTGIPQQSSAGYTAAVVQVNPYPSSGFGQLDADTRATIENQYATSDLAQGTTTGAMTTLGQIRSHSESLNQQISNLEADSYSNDPIRAIRDGRAREGQRREPDSTALAAGHEPIARRRYPATDGCTETSHRRPQPYDQPSDLLSAELPVHHAKD